MPLTRSAPLTPATTGTASPAVAPAEWLLSPICPAGWAESVARCGGGYFQTPAALSTSLPAGKPLFASLVRGGETVGVALGSAAGCRLSAIPRHPRFASWPAVAAGVDAGRAARSLVARLAAQGAAEVAFDSFDAPHPPGPPAGSVAGRERLEHLVPLFADPDEQRRGWESNHRRRARRGERAGWSLRAHTGPEALALLRPVVRTASRRAALRGDAYSPELSDRLAALPPCLPTDPWGACVFAARAGDTLLAAALVGWGGGRGYYLIGGSTAEGYREAAAPWLHGRVMERLAAAGCATYNLGGTPAAAGTPGHPSHGLFQFKAGFGGREVACRGARWELLPGHLRLHRLAERAGALLRR